MGFPLGLLFRHVLHPSHTSLTTRHLFSSLTGLTLTTLCFGWYVTGSVLPHAIACVCYDTGMHSFTHLYVVVFINECIIQGSRQVIMIGLGTRRVM